MKIQDQIWLVIFNKYSLVHLPFPGDAANDSFGQFLNEGEQQ